MGCQEGVEVPFLSFRGRGRGRGPKTRLEGRPALGRKVAGSNPGVTRIVIFGALRTGNTLPGAVWPSLEAGKYTSPVSQLWREPDRGLEPWFRQECAGAQELCKWVARKELRFLSFPGQFCFLRRFFFGSGGSISGGLGSP